MIQNSKRKHLDFFCDSTVFVTSLLGVLFAVSFGAENSKAQNTTYPNLDHHEGLLVPFDFNQDNVTDVVSVNSYFDQNSSQFLTSIRVYEGGVGAPDYLRPLPDPAQPSQPYSFDLNAILIDQPVISGGHLYLLTSNFRSTSIDLDVFKIHSNGTVSLVRSHFIPPSGNFYSIQTARVEALPYDLDGPGSSSGDDVIVSWAEVRHQTRNSLRLDEPGRLFIAVASPAQSPNADPNLLTFPTQRDQSPNQIIELFKTYRNSDTATNGFFTLALTSDSINNRFVGAEFFQLQFDPSINGLKRPTSGDRMRVPGPNLAVERFLSESPSAVSTPVRGMTWGVFHFQTPNQEGSPLFQFSHFMGGISLGLASVTNGTGNFTFLDPNQLALGEIVQTHYDERFLPHATRDIDGDGLEEVVFIGGHRYSSRPGDFEGPFLVIASPESNPSFAFGHDYSVIGAGVHDAVWGDFKGDGTADDLLVSLTRSSDLVLTGRFSFLEGIVQNGNPQLLLRY